MEGERPGGGDAGEQRSAARRAGRRTRHGILVEDGAVYSRSNLSISPSPSSSRRVAVLRRSFAAEADRSSIGPANRLEDVDDGAARPRCRRDLRDRPFGRLRGTRPADCRLALDEDRLLAWRRRPRLVRRAADRRGGAHPWRAGLGADGGGRTGAAPAGSGARSGRPPRGVARVEQGRVGLVRELRPACRLCRAPASRRRSWSVGRRRARHASSRRTWHRPGPLNGPRPAARPRRSTTSRRVLPALPASGVSQYFVRPRTGTSVTFPSRASSNPLATRYTADLW